MIPAKQFEGELWIKASDLHIEVKRAIEAEREACAKVCQEEIDRVKPLYSVVAENAMKAIRARGQA
jgi:hypothetical protein